MDDTMSRLTEDELMGQNEVLIFQSKMNNWYPYHKRKRTNRMEIRAQIMKEAWQNGFNVKQIASYFRVSLCGVYDNINITMLKKKRREMLLKETGK